MILKKRIGGRRSGLTLFELLISLALLAAISAAMGSAFSFAGRVYARSAEMESMADTTTARIHLRRWLNMAATPSLNLRQVKSFVGEPDRLEFTTLAVSGIAKDAGAIRIIIHLENGSLIMKAQGMDDSGAPMDQHVILLAENAESLEIRYFGDGDDGDWLDSWPEDATTLPAGVRISLAEGSVPDWPEMIVRPTIGRTP